MDGANGQRFAEICSEIEQITDKGNEVLDLEAVDAEGAQEQLLALAEGPEDPLMCLHNTLCSMKLMLSEKTSAGKLGLIELRR